MDMYSVVLTGVPRTYPASAFNRFSAYISSIRAQLALWFRSYSESLFPNAEKVTKKACPWRTAFAPVPLRGHAATGHPWPIAALPASMPVDPLRRTSTRPADGASRSKSKARSKAAEAVEAVERPVWMRDLRTTGGLDRQQSFYRVICLPQVTANANPSYFNSPSLLNFAPSILLADLDV